MTPSHSVIADLRAEVDVPRGGILSRTLHEADGLGLTVFAFDAGQELTEHTSNRAAVIEVLDGTAEITVGGDLIAARPGTWISMTAGTPHAVRATSPLVLSLLLLRQPE